jgi:chemotaxis protein methyltransferase CheR
MAMLQSAELSSAQFKKISQLVYSIAGIDMTPGKKALVKSRLMKRLRKLEMNNFDEYLNYIKSSQGSSERGLMVDALTTNKTSFFRENAHFTYMAENILPSLKKKRVRMWCAACSSGEEPYTMSIVLNEKMPNISSRDVRILATDISYDMLSKAQRAVYTTSRVNGLPSSVIKKYFDLTTDNGRHVYKVKKTVRRLVHLAWLNLMEPWPMKGPLDIIFCRNVMIYFDTKTKQRLIDRFWDILAPGGYLFVGHSEGLSGISHRFESVRPAAYRKGN